MLKNPILIRQASNHFKNSTKRKEIITCGANNMGDRPIPGLCGGEVLTIGSKDPPFRTPSGGGGSGTRWPLLGIAGSSPAPFSPSFALAFPMNQIHKMPPAFHTMHQQCHSENQGFKEIRRNVKGFALIHGGCHRRRREGKEEEEKGRGGGKGEGVVIGNWRG